MHKVIPDYHFTYFSLVPADNAAFNFGLSSPTVLRWYEKLRHRAALLWLEQVGETISAMERLKKLMSAAF